MNRPRAFLLSVLVLGGTACHAAVIRPAAARAELSAGVVAAQRLAAPGFERSAALSATGNYARIATPARRQNAARVFAPDLGALAPTVQIERRNSR